MNEFDFLYIKQCVEFLVRHNKVAKYLLNRATSKP